jgi:hydroxyacylglutathione hydrolase
MISAMTTVTMIPLGISNAYLLRGERPVLVDSGAPGRQRQIVAALRACGLELSELALIIHTHGHTDHFGSTAALCRSTSVPTAVHEADATAMAEGRNDALRPSRTSSYPVRAIAIRSAEAVKADVLLEDGASLEPYGVDARVWHTPGHTPGSISVITGSGEAVIGDALMGGHLGGFVSASRPRFHYFAHDLAAARASVRRLLDFEPRRIYVGHGGPLQPAPVRQWLDGLAVG